MAVLVLFSLVAIIFKRYSKLVICHTSYPECHNPVITWAKDFGLHISPVHSAGCHTADPLEATPCLHAQKADHIDSGVIMISILFFGLNLKVTIV